MSDPLFKKSAPDSSIANMNAKMTTNSTRIQETGCGAACLRIKTHSLYIPKGSGTQEEQGSPPPTKDNMHMVS